MHIIIGTRGSKLALAQTEYVKDRLQARYSEHTFEIRVITTRGDQITDRPLNRIGGKGLFVREIEERLLSGEIQMAVHSMKDMPAVLPEGLMFTRAWKREDPRDVLILREKSSLSELPAGAVIGTGSVRRQALLRLMRPDLKPVAIRGNVDTRLRKMQEQQLDGIVLAAAGLHRLGMEERITQYLSCEEMIPAPAQGALALEIRRDSPGLEEMLNRFAEEESEFTVRAEREFLRLCGGDCHMPVGAVCEKMPTGNYRMRVVAGEREGKNLSFSEVDGTDPVRMAEEAVTQLGKRCVPDQKGRGTVYLVGAGPGDPGLITVRGRELLRQADCVIYDRLISDELLREVRSGCELVYVGKENHHHTMRQEEIHTLLSEKTDMYQKVVRLKGGDPFVFGRGGEEALALLEQGIHVEVVPGVTSAVAGAALAGIPVTHRGVSGGFHVVTAHDRRDALADIDFVALAKSGETCIFLMGLGMLSEIVERLTEAGMPENMDVAVISHATLPEQRVCQGTLADIAGTVQKEGLTSPALIVVGTVVKLRRTMAGLAEPPSVRTCLIPKIGSQTTTLAQKLQASGISVEEVQVGEIQYTDWQPNLSSEKKPDWLVFTSSHGVDGFFHGIMSAGEDVRSFAGCRIAAVGRKTAGTLRRYGLQPDLLPETADSKALCVALREVLQGEDVVWYLKAEVVDSRLEEGLSGCCCLIERNVYRNQEVEVNACSGKYDAIAFTCASSVRRLHASGQDFGDSILYSMGPMCTEQLRRLGMKHCIQADNASCEALAEKILETLL